MDRILNDFIGLLRRHRVRVSPAEGLDALEALRHVGLGEREGVRDTLRTTLIKSSEDVETFERLFELFFGLTPEPAAPAHLHPHVHDPGGTATELRFGEDLEGDPDDGDHDHSHEDPSRSTCAASSTRSSCGPRTTSTASPSGCGCRCSGSS